MPSQSGPHDHVVVFAGRQPCAKLFDANDAPVGGPGYVLVVDSDQFDVIGCTVTGRAVHDCDQVLYTFRFALSTYPFFSVVSRPENRRKPAAL